jgi:prolyl 3-hydroxylase /prolyl 3,4-dihydroxylase
MAPHEGEDDPAVYGSGSKKSKPEANGEEHGEEDGDAEEEEEDGTLLTVPAGFNQLLLVLRDEKVLRFVKYVSASAVGSRWDVSGEYQVDMIKQDDEDAVDEAEVERGVSLSSE